MSKPLYAHTLEGRSPEEWHELVEHLSHTAELAGAFASSFGAEGWGQLAGLWHDIGKSSQAFQEYLVAAAGEGGSNVHQSELRGRVDHSTAGAQHAARVGPAGRLLAYAIAGHHAGLPENVGEAASLTARLEKQVHPLGPVPESNLRRGLPGPPRLLLPGSATVRDKGFTLAFFTRMLFSCLVDADFLDTESFMNSARSRHREQPRASCGELLDRLDQHLAAMPERGSEMVNRCRRDVLAACREQAALAPGFFSLHVPTGGGKTLSSLAFALTHAIAHGRRRVIYAIPFTSIIEQTASVFREALADLGDEVLEHHSNLEPEEPGRQSDRTRLAAENFDATLIVTTNVQLFESLFACRTSRCRKLHRLAESVIILDEAQTLPVSLLWPTLSALRELVNNYGASVVLCSATQPAIERREDFRIGVEGVRPIIAEPRRLHTALRRNNVERLGQVTNEALGDHLRSERQVLCIVNSRRHAADLFGALDDPKALHLSASMCAAHRSNVVAAIRCRLLSGAPCRVISTQVIEAGVDVDFPAVFRAEAGLDSIAQAAGRCNREGRLTDAEGNPRDGRVVVFAYDAKEYPTAFLIARAGDRFREVAPDHEADLLSPRAIEDFFRLHYWHQGGEGGRGWDRGTEGQSILDCFHADPKVFLHAQFRTAASAYRLIERAQTPVLVPYGGPGRKLMDELSSMPPDPDPAWLRSFDRRAQRYITSVFDAGLKTLLANGVLLEFHGRYCLRNPEAYDSKLGLRFEVLGLDP